MPSRIILIGQSGTGKSSLAGTVAEMLGWEVRDTDAEVARRFDLPIWEIFERFGEPVFRAAEQAALADALSSDHVVVATGGGVPLEERNWIGMRPDSLIVHLAAAPEVIVSRLRDQIAAAPGERRPLLETGDPEAAVRAQREQRAAVYAQADLTIETDGLTPVAVARRVVDAVTGQASLPVPVACLGVPGGRSDLYVAPGLVDRAGELIARRWPNARRVWVVSDANVWPLWGPAVEGVLTRADLTVTHLPVPAGEASKSLDQVTDLLDWMIGGRIDRRDVVVALGGGVVGDLAGFVAAIVLRGVPLVQLPTSLLAMVDSSVGGKTGVNHRLGKNLIGAFYQPPLVIADTAMLETLPAREWRAGFAEVVKHGMIERTATGNARAELLSLLESLPPRPEPGQMAEIVRRNVLIKAEVVRQDERETGLRRILNYGHTLGHAMEAAGYRYIHGEAVALGMRAAARLGQLQEVTPDELVDRQGRLLSHYGLPDRFEGRLELVMERLTRDKKAVNGRLTWILPGTGAGDVEIRQDVPLDRVARVASELGASAEPLGTSSAIVL